MVHGHEYFFRFPPTTTKCVSIENEKFPPTHDQTPSGFAVEDFLSYDQTPPQGFAVEDWLSYNQCIVIDKAAIAAVVILGGLTFYKKCALLSRFSCIYEKITIVATFLFVILLYCYGWYIQDYCFSPDTNQANEYHMLMHLVGSLGHHLIALTI
jgi:hypothetical protein